MLLKLAIEGLGILRLSDDVVVKDPMASDA
jgi:hypothetical protein